MRTASDLAPLFRSSVGFDRAFDLPENAARLGTPGNWPPCDIRKTGDDQYIITMTVAGFQPDQLSVTFEANRLVVRGTDPDGNDTQCPYRGIEASAFEHRFDAGRPRQGRPVVPGERPAHHRAGAREAGGVEATPDPDPDGRCYTGRSQVAVPDQAPEKSSLRPQGYRNSAGARSRRTPLPVPRFSTFSPT
jgi:HSP20 family molecular chaperone IbpA